MLQFDMFIGLTGGIACGKSLVASHFQQLGAAVIDTDELAHELLEPGRPGYDAVLAAFGREILDAGGAGPAINRRRLADIVFADSTQRARLETILHPLIFAEASRRRLALEAADPDGVIVFVVPLLFETGADQLVEHIVAVVSDEETQVARLVARDGINRDEALRRVRAQWPVSEKQRRADDWIDGTQAPDDVRRQVEALYKKLKASG